MYLNIVRRKMAGEVRFRLNDNLDPLQTLDICHEIVNMTFCATDRSFTLKKCIKKRSVDRYDSSESSDSGVATFITELGSPMTPDSRVSEYSIPSPVECESIMAPPPPIQNSTDEIDITCWPWGEEWPGDCSNLELFSDTSDTDDCKTEKDLTCIELNKSLEENSCDEKVFQNSSKVGGLFNTSPLTECKKIESCDNKKSNCDFVPPKSYIVTVDESPIKYSLCEDDVITSSEIINNDKTAIKAEEFLSDQLSPSYFIKCSDQFEKTVNNLSSNISTESNGDRLLESCMAENLNSNLSNSDANFRSPKKKICLDVKTTDTSDKGGYFMRSSSGSCHDQLNSKPSLLVDQNKNIQHNILMTAKSKFSINNLIDEKSCTYKSNNLNEKLNSSQTNISSDDMNPKKLRFPKLDTHWISLSGNIVCHWNGCDSYFNTSAKLIEHLQVKHVNIQKCSETFVCLWNDCKVFNKPSCSRSWLERHVLSHAGNKPLQCIVQKCRQRFSSQIMLERHVNQHFKVSNKEEEGNNGKLIRRKGKKLRLRRQPFSARKFDYFDQATMMELQAQLFLSSVNSQHDFIDYSRRAIRFRPNVVAQRILEGSKDSEVLVRWFPPELLDDEWITCDKSTNFNINERVVPIMSLSIESRNTLVKLFGNIFPPVSRRPRK
ncbi:uncharacterized protein LOC126898551 [Daktulosphaira vitifoliae]|uniref:uncharacterized protein LOC126898551 n=1 Tax=Daktulosphaira vitifoliae TaxID=58002 RepID=UPI0021AA9CD4|nr:uncharacterized protein LOC126898551 [Daktulosphaira vitifoliae]